MTHKPIPLPRNGKPQSVAAVIPGPRRLTRSAVRLTGAVFLTLLAPFAADAQIVAQLQPVLRQGDPVAGGQVRGDGAFLVGALRERDRGA